MSDNGGLSLDYARGGKSHTQNLPLRAGKGSVYEGGIREPMIVKWPGVTRAGTKSDQPVIIEDFFPSILEIAGLHDAKFIQEIDGKSFVPLLKGEKYNSPNRSLVWHNPHKWTTADGPGINYFSALRQGSWKLVYNHRNETLELYNLEKDLGELVNLAHKEKAIARKLAKVLSQQLREWNAQMPVNKATGRTVKLPDMK